MVAAAAVVFGEGGGAANTDYDPPGAAPPTAAQLPPGRRRAPPGPGLARAGPSARRPRIVGLTGASRAAGRGAGRRRAGRARGRPRSLASKDRSEEGMALRAKLVGRNRGRGPRALLRRMPALHPAGPPPPPRRAPPVIGITPDALARSSQSSSGPAGGASDGYGLGRGAAGPPGPQVCDYRGRGTPSHRLGRIRSCSATVHTDRERSGWLT